MSNTYTPYPSGGPGGYPSQQPGQQPRFQHPYQQRGPSPPQNMSRPPTQGAFHMNSPYGVMSGHPQQAIYTIPYQQQVGVQYHVLSQTAQYQQPRMPGGTPGGGGSQVMSQAAPPFTPGAQYGGGHPMYSQHHGAPQSIIYSGGGGPHSLGMGMTPQGPHLGMYQGHRYPMGIPQPQQNINISQVPMTQGPPGGSLVPPQGAPPPHSQQQQQQQPQQPPQQQPPQPNMYSQQPPRGPVVSIATSGPPPSTTPQPVSQSFHQAPPAPVSQPPPVSQPSNTLSRQRNRNPIKIIDPNTKQEVKVDNTISSKSTPAPSSDQSSTSSTPAPPEPVSSEREKSTGPKSREVATEFAAKVAALAEGSGSGSAKKEESSPSPSSSPPPSLEGKKELSPEDVKLEESVPAPAPAPAEKSPEAESIPVLAVPPVEEAAASPEKVSVTSSLVVSTDIKRDENLYEPVSPTPLPDSPSDDTNKPVTETVKPSPFEEVINKKAGESDKKEEELPNSRKKKPSTAAKKAALNSKAEKKGDLLDVFTSLEDSQAKPEEASKEVAELADGIEELSISKPAETIPAPEAVENHENKDGEAGEAPDAPKMNGVVESTEVNSENELEDGEILDDENDSADSKSVQLKYDYPTGQWSPLNPEGKKQYGREFLITLMRDPLSMQKPNNLPKMEIVKDQPNPRQPQNRIDFNPPYVMKGSNSRQGGGVSKRNSQGGDKRGRGDRVDGRNKEVRVISLPSISQEVKLNKAENAWMPSVKDKKKEADPKESEMEELRRKALAILNKLTPQKFETLVQRFQELPIDSYQKLATCMELVFEKAVDEPSFSVAYAMMCQELQKKKVPDENKPDENVNFRKLLISRYYRANLIQTYVFYHYF